jgi:O-antigen biosynthesis protein
MDRVAIYTAIFGGYDSLRDQPACPGVDYVCFTDDPQLNSSQWTVRLAPSRYQHPRMSAKWFKMLSHKALADFRYTIWIDGGIQLASNHFADAMLSALDGRGIALIRHPVRDNILEEAEFSVELPRYRDLPMLGQVAHYRSKGFKDDWGLYAGTIIVRDNAIRRIRCLNRLWMKANLRWTYKDQLSLPYLLWKLDIEPAVISCDLWHNDLFSMVPHLSEL